MTARELAAAALVTPDAAGALADHLDEIGDPRGRLLRIRWRRFRTEYHRAERHRTAEDGQELFKWLFGRAMNATEIQRVVERDREHAVASFARYLRERFREELA